MMAETLPPDTIAGALKMVCPWCKESCCEAMVTLEDLLCAWEHHETDFATREDDGTAGGCALTAECPNCGHPFMVTLKRNRNEGRYMRLLPVRTSADAQFLTGAPKAAPTFGEALAHAYEARGVVLPGSIAAPPAPPTQQGESA